MTKIGWSILGVALWSCGGTADPVQPPASGPPPLPPATTAPAASTPCDAVQSSALSTALQARMADEAPGAKAEGASLCNVASEGIEVVSPPIQLEQGYCYTGLGEALPPVGEVDIFLRLDLTATGLPLVPQLLPFTQQPILVDAMTGLHAGMGTKKGCYLWTLPNAQARLVAKSTKGGPGPIAAQLYKKKQK